MDRRAFLQILTLGLLATPLAAPAQPATRVYRMGFLGASQPAGLEDWLEDLRAGLREHGYVEGRTFTLE